MRSHQPELCRAARVALVILAVATMPSCDRDAPDSAADTGAAGLRPDTGRALQLADPELYATCDSLERWVNGAVRRGSERRNGQFTGSARGVTRYGCRITAADTITPDLPQRPLEGVWQTLVAGGWTLDQAYVADGPEGSMLGLRSGTQLCVLAHSWQTGSDDERATRPDVPVPYEMSVECFREAPR